MIFQLLYNNSLFINFANISFLIGIGIYLRYSNFINEKNHQFLTSFCLNFILPYFILASFMQDVDESLYADGSSVLIWGLAIHVILLIGCHVYYTNRKDMATNDKILLKNILPMGSTPFFGMAVVKSIYGSDGALVANIYNIPFRIFLYSICMLSISGIKFTKKNLIRLIKNPALIASLLGFAIFFIQNITPQITINRVTHSILRLDHSMPFIFKAIKGVGSILTPLIWIIIGCSLTKENLLFAFKSKKALIFALQKIILIPMLGIFIYIMMRQYTNFSISSEFIGPILILLVCPVSNVLVVVSLEYKRSSQLCLGCFLTSTILALLMLPFYIAFLEYLLRIKII